jgi:hypothetical protein
MRRPSVTEKGCQFAIFSYMAPSRSSSSSTRKTVSREAPIIWAISSYARASVTFTSAFTSHGLCRDPARSGANFSAAE